MARTHGSISRRALFGSAVAGAAATAGAAPAMAATPDAPDDSAALWREFTADPFTRPWIPFIGRAGYRAGCPLPRRSSKPGPHAFVTDVVRDHGARPDGSADAAPAINRAIAAAGERGGGTVTVPAGTYRIDDIIRIGHSDVVVRGAGSGATKLYATRSLTELIGVHGSRYGGDKSSRSWAGGLIWLCPKGRWASLTDAIRAKEWGRSRAGPATAATCGAPSPSRPP